MFVYTCVVFPEPVSAVMITTGLVSIARVIWSFFAHIGKVFRVNNKSSSTAKRGTVIGLSHISGRFLLQLATKQNI